MKTEFNISTNIVYRFYNVHNNMDLIKDTWIYLLKKSKHSYFLSWGWISTWIKSLPENSKVVFAVGYKKETAVFAFFIGMRNYLRNGFVYSRRLSLNSTGNPYFDKLYIEYNSILIDPNENYSLFSLIKELPYRWNEIILPGLSSSLFPGNSLETGQMNGFNVFCQTFSKSYFVELQKVRDNNNDFLSMISSNKRGQIRRSIKKYEEHGKLEILPATSLDEALAMLDNLASYHQKRWQKKGVTGAFANEYFFEFHRDLLKNRFINNEIHLLHIKYGENTVGYLYNFVYNKDIYFYQSGFDYPAQNVYKPGLVSHYLAIQYYSQKEYLTYDFLADDSQYKKSLSTNHNDMSWIRIQKPRIRFRLENSLKEIIVKLAALTSKKGK